MTNQSDKKIDRDKISVIIPVYNREKYLRDCLDSVINQTFKNLEIICIDDCSTDNSKEILNEYAKKDARIVVLNRTENSGGPGAGRNDGLRFAHGEYISFIDSDDFIESNRYENLYNAIKKYDCDCVYGDLIFFKENGEPFSPYIKYSKPYGQIEKFDVGQYQVQYLFKYERIKDIEYPVGCDYEDSASFAQLLMRNDTTLRVYGANYRYRNSANSSCAGYTDRVRFFYKVLDFINDKVMPQYKDSKKYKKLKNFAEMTRKFILRKVERRMPQNSSLKFRFNIFFEYSRYMNIFEYWKYIYAYIFPFFLRVERRKYFRYIIFFNGKIILKQLRPKGKSVKNKLKRNKNENL